MFYFFSSTMGSTKGGLLTLDRWMELGNMLSNWQQRRSINLLCHSIHSGLMRTPALSNYTCILKITM